MSWNGLPLVALPWLTQAMGSPNALPQGNGQGSLDQSWAVLDFVSVGSFGQLQMFEIKIYKFFLKKTQDLFFIY
jgi:hypothetical protein